MEPKEIQKIIKNFEASSLMTLELEKDGFKLKLSKLTPAEKIISANETSDISEEHKIYVKSPLVGTFYSSGGANQSAFVSVGDIVEEGQVLCLVEAMKIMNELTSPQKARIKQIYVNNKDAVGFNQVLMELEEYGK